MKRVIVVIILVLVFGIAFWLLWEKWLGLQIYENLKFGLSFKIPREYKWASQNGEETIIFVKKDDFKNLQKDPLFASNPLLVVTQHKVNGYFLEIISPAAYKNLEEYLTAPAGGVENGKFGEFKVNLKYLKATNGNSLVYFYETEIEKKSPIKERGIAGIKNKTLFKFAPLNDAQYTTKETTELLNLAASSLRIK